MAYRDLWKRNWVAMSKRVWCELLVDDAFGASAQLAYYFMLAFFPFIVFLAALATLMLSMAPGELEVTTLQLLAEVMPPQALDLIDKTVGQTLRVLQEKNARVLVFSVVLALWSATSGMRAVMVTLNRAWNVREGRPFWYRYLLSLALTVALGLTFVFAVPILSLSPAVGEWLAERVGPFAATAWNLGSRTAPVVALVLVIEAIYYFAPNARRPWHWATPGSILAVMLWLLATILFSYYVSRFGRYEALYAGLASPVVLLLWFYLSGLSILVGGEMNAEIERASGDVPHMQVPARPMVDEAGHDTTVKETPQPKAPRRRRWRRRSRAGKAGADPRPHPSSHS
jgi:membrane protein